MSHFFEPPPPREPERPERQPPWLAPPANELGVPVPLHALLARTAAESEQLRPESDVSPGGGTIVTDG